MKKLFALLLALALALSLCACSGSNPKADITKKLIETNWYSLPYKKPFDQHEYVTDASTLRSREDGTGDVEKNFFKWELDGQTVRYTLQSNGYVIDLEIVDCEGTTILVRADDYKIVFVSEADYDYSVSEKKYSDYGAVYKN